MTSNTNPMEEKVSKILFVSQSSPNSALCQDLTVINSFTLTSSIDPITADCIFVISQKNNEVYNFLCHNYVGKVYHSLSRNRVGKYISCSNEYLQQTRQNEKIMRIPTSIPYDSV